MSEKNRAVVKISEKLIERILQGGWNAYTSNAPNDLRVLSLHAPQPEDLGWLYALCESEAFIEQQTEYDVLPFVTFTFEEINASVICARCGIALPFSLVGKHLDGCEPREAWQDFYASWMGDD